MTSKSFRLGEETHRIQNHLGPVCRISITPTLFFLFPLLTRGAASRLAGFVLQGGFFLENELLFAFCSPIKEPPAFF